MSVAALVVAGAGPGVALAGRMAAPATPETLALYGVETEDINGARIFIKKARIRAGSFVEEHVHDFDHFGLCVSGDASVEIDGVSTLVEVGEPILLKAGVKHGILAHSDTLWLCIWNSDVAMADPGFVDKSQLKG